MQVAPEKARKRREDAEKDARVQRWAEDSGNAALAGRELPPAEVLAADQRISWWARQLRKAGLPGSMDELRARAYLDLLLDKDSRPAAPAPASDGTSAATGTTGESAASGTAGGSGGGAGTGAPGSGTPPNGCTAPTCRRPATQADFEHNTPYEAGGRTCLCNGGPKCRHDHRLKQHPSWKVEQITPATFRWTAPSGRTCTTEATRYPI